MKKALANLRKSKLSAKMAADDFEITPTHLYVKFTPKNEQELDILMVDSTLVLYDYPLDYEIAINGDFYRDPDIPEDQPTPQYCAVKVTYPFAQSNSKVKGNAKLMENVEKTILAELFIPDEEFDIDDTGSTNKTDNATMKKINGKMVSVELIDALVEEALRITNNLDKSVKQNKTSKIMRGSWRPAGRIQVWDDFIGGYVGVEGAQVRARKWFTTHRGWVGADGYYSCDGTFKRKANYSIDWDRNGVFYLQDGWLNGATNHGPKQEGNWDLNLKDNKQEYYATIFRAAHHYYYKDIKGLRRPPQNSFLKTKLRIRACYETDDDRNGSHKPSRRFLGLGSAIKIYNPENKTEEIYGTVIHELAHASHWGMDRSNYLTMNDCDDTFLGLSCSGDAKVAESWAVGVQWELTRIIYPTYRGRSWNTTQPKYTPVVIDMIDNFGDDNGGSENLEIDNVDGYTIRQIEDALIGQKKWTNWRNKIKDDYSNAKAINLDKLFMSYE